MTTKRTKRSHLQSAAKPIISVKEARKLLGKPSEQLSDTQIGDIVHTLHLMARHYLHNSGSKKTSGVVQSSQEI